MGNFVNRFSDTTDTQRGHFLSMARLSPEKGLRALLAAAEKAPDLPVLIAGHGPLAAEAQRLVRERRLDHVQCLGQVDGTVRDHLLSQALALVCPSEWYENFPLSVVEALAAGTPVIASRIGGLPEIVEDGRTGVLISPGSVDELLAAMRRISAHAELREAMGREALSSAKRRFSPATHLEALLSAFVHARSESGVSP